MRELKFIFIFKKYFQNKDSVLVNEAVTCNRLISEGLK